MLTIAYRLTTEFRRVIASKLKDILCALCALARKSHARVSRIISVYLCLHLSSVSVAKYPHIHYFCTMKKSRVKRNLVLGTLFFLPVVFLLFLYPAKHHYVSLDVVKGTVPELDNILDENGEPLTLQNHITALGFLGENPMEMTIPASNVKELVYDKFKGFKTFQVVMLLPEGKQDEAQKLKAEIINYGELKFWHFGFADSATIQKLYNSLKAEAPLKANLASEQLFIIDKERNQRGRLDDRTDNEIEKNDTVYGLNSYNCIEVSELKNKLSEDIRILFTEYRQKRKGDFDSSARRAQDLNGSEE